MRTSGIWPALLVCTATARTEHPDTATDPFKSDTDGDTVSDLLDHYPLDPTRAQKPPPNPSDTTPPVIIRIYPTTAVLIGVAIGVLLRVTRGDVFSI